MSAPELKERHTAALDNVASLRERLKQKRTQLLDTDVARYSLSQGRLLFAGYTNGNFYVWDSLLAKVVLNLGSLQNSHDNRISCLSLSADGSALCTGSWDSNLKIFAQRSRWPKRDSIPGTWFLEVAFLKNPKKKKESFRLSWTMVPMKSQHLHNLALPCLKWGHKKQRRDVFIEGVGVDEYSGRPWNLRPRRPPVSRKPVEIGTAHDDDDDDSPENSWVLE